MEGASFITPIQPWGRLGELSQGQEAAVVNTEASLFKDIFKKVINEITVRGNQHHRNELDFSDVWDWNLCRN